MARYVQSREYIARAGAGVIIYCHGGAFKELAVGLGQQTRVFQLDAPSRNLEQWHVLLRWIPICQPTRQYPYLYFDDLPRRVYSVLTQVRTGHRFLGGCYHRRAPWRESPAATADTHMFTECSRMQTGTKDRAARFTCPPYGRTPRHPKGIEAVVGFITPTGAFTNMKSGREDVARGI